ncbi:hypothetical protein VOLCADRAFT_84238 [Volvox carteri f. nagariensis]|uniref:Pre-mRNA processing factor 4 (PRP4)-like domain-containing protein n=1 Tax=Volvox carteri f. nagariensis TaxID=3068 RepID=D8UGV8_VOLCA|nr:uncharacterized protein VOLCADRAFT_84238 [Volvox carteri f. nagariensis]EFJ41018.1 hypothetical protein VOLCADRAFT_84238 [Volvox carteri f. nagariensis]|eukprot:XP_002957882.1 hypothetical protein VOLCADRAFT_84238 [Volvox carteri f. nagariensis]
MADVFALPESGTREREAHAAKLREFELRRKIRQVVVPTDDGKVRQLLRQLGEPVTLFGEREMERRERLKRIIAQRDGELDLDLPTTEQTLVEEVAVQKLFYTEGPDELRTARLALTRYSLLRAKARLLGAKRRREDPGALQASASAQSAAADAVRTIVQQSSELGDTRPISHCQFSPDGACLAACGWGGALTLWSVPACVRQWTAPTPSEAPRLTGVAWHPAAAPGQLTHGSSPGAAAAEPSSTTVVSLASAASDGLIRTLEGHTERLGRLAFHPLGQHLATASFDTTWRLWDVETGLNLLEQEGHSRAVYGVAFHPDGSLVGSAGLDAYGRIWDCRTGRSVLLLEGHVKQLLSIDFSPNGHHVATGSEDHTAKVWDLRKRGCLYTLPAHTSLLSTVRWERTAGHYLLTAGYDCVAKLWNGRDFTLLKALAGHEGKVMGADVSPTGDHLVATVSYDRTIKMWAPEKLPPVLPPP